MQAALTRSNELLNEHNQATAAKPIKHLLAEAIRSSNPCVVQELKAVCQKHTEEKTLADCLLILRQMEEFASFRENRRVCIWNKLLPFIHRFPLFSELDDQEYLILALSLRYREYKPWEALCRIGDAPSEIYYVLEGKIAVTSVNSITYTEEALQDKIFHNEGAGATLGEASILYNSNRTASLVAATPAAILFMLKEPYMRTIGDLVRKAHLYRIEMIQKQDIFSKWTMAQLASLYRNFEKKELAYGVIIYKAGDKNDMIYVILKGEIEILAKPQTEAIKQGLFINRNVEKKPAVVIKKIGDSCYFGNEEGFDQEEKVYTAKVSSYSCSLIQISKKKIRQNANYEPELMAFIYSQSNKKKVFFEKEKVNVFERNKQMFGKKTNQVINLNPKDELTGREPHFRSPSNLEEGSVYTQPEPAGTSPRLKMRNYAESLLQAAQLYKDPGSIDSAVFDAPNKKSWKSQNILNKSGSDQTKPLLVQQIPTEMSTQTMFLPNNRELLHGTQQRSLIENIQKMQKEQNKHPQIVFDGKRQASSEWSQVSPNPGQYASKSNRNHIGSSTSQEDTFDGQSACFKSARAIDFVDAKEAHPIFEAIRIEQEESRNQQQGKLGPRTQLLDQVNQVLIQSMFTEKQQIRMQKKHKTYKPPAHRNSQISDVSWGDELPVAVPFHVGSSLNNYSSSMVKDIKKLVQSTDMSLIQNSSCNMMAKLFLSPENLESEVSGVTGHLLQLQRGAEFVKVLDLSRADAGGSHDQDSRIVHQYPKIYAREQRISGVSSKDTAMTIQARKDLLTNPGPRGPPDPGSKKASQFRKYQVVNNRSQPIFWHLNSTDDRKPLVSRYQQGPYNNKQTKSNQGMEQIMELPLEARKAKIETLIKNNPGKLPVL